MCIQGFSDNFALNLEYVTDKTNLSDTQYIFTKFLIRVSQKFKI